MLMVPAPELMFAPSVTAFEPAMEILPPVVVMFVASVTASALAREILPVVVVIVPPRFNTPLVTVASDTLPVVMPIALGTIKSPPVDVTLMLAALTESIVSGPAVFVAFKSPVVVTDRWAPSASATDTPPVPAEAVIVAACVFRGWAGVPRPFDALRFRAAEPRRPRPVVSVMFEGPDTVKAPVVLTNPAMSSVPNARMERGRAPASKLFNVSDPVATFTVSPVSPAIGPVTVWVPSPVQPALIAPWERVMTPAVSVMV